MKHTKRLDSTELPACVILTEAAIGHAMAMVRSLGRRKITVYVLVIPWHPWIPSIYEKSRYCKAVHTIQEATTAVSVCDSALDWLKKQAFTTKPILMPITDRTCTFVAECRERYQAGFELCMASNEVVLGMLDKQTASTMARNAGLSVPETHFATSQRELDNTLAACTFPVVVKPTWWRKQGSREFKAARCDDQNELMSQAGQLIQNGAHVLIQQYIPGNDDDVEVYMFYRTRDGKTIHGCTGQKLRQFPPHFGDMASGRSTDLPHIATLSEKLLRNLDYRGLGGIEYKCHGDKHYFIEMSVRPEGFHMLAIGAGVDLPWLAYSDMVGLPRKERAQPQRQISYINGRSHFYLWLKHWKQVPVLQETLKMMHLGRTQFNLWSWRDPLPWCAATMQLMKELISGIKSKLLRRIGPRI